MDRAPDPARPAPPGAGVVRGLTAAELAEAAGDFLARFPWDGPPPDPALLSAEAFLSGL